MVWDTFVPPGYLLRIDCCIAVFNILRLSRCVTFITMCIDYFDLVSSSCSYILPLDSLHARRKILVFGMWMIISVEFVLLHHASHNIIAETSTHTFMLPHTCDITSWQTSTHTCQLGYIVIALRVRKIVYTCTHDARNRCWVLPPKKKCQWARLIHTPVVVVSKVAQTG